MTELRTLQLAYYGALDLWDMARAKHEQFPDNETMANNEARAWDELTNISNLLYDAEQKKIREEELRK